MGKGSRVAAAVACGIALAQPPGAWAHVFGLHIAAAALVAPAVSVKEPRVRGEWVPGHWEWQGDGHVWVQGHTTLPRKAYAWGDDGVTTTTQAPQPNEQTRY
jgi:hypothetical protein